MFIYPAKKNGADVFVWGGAIFVGQLFFWVEEAKQLVVFEWFIHLSVFLLNGFA